MKWGKGAAGQSENKSAARTNESNYRKKYGQYQERFLRHKLPSPINVLDRLDLSIGRVNNAGYIALKYPFHENGAERNLSLFLNNIRGNFRCYTCDARGGDILAFYIKFTGFGFVDAAKKLNAWGRSL